MTTGRKITRVVLVVVLVVTSGIFWRNNHTKNQVKNPPFNYEEIEKNLKELNKQLDKMLAETDSTISGRKHLPLPGKEVVKSYHDEKNGKKNYEDSWTQDIDRKEGLVLVMTVDSKMSVIFKPAPEDMERFHVGSLAPVTFHCTKLKKGKCDFKAPYKLFVSNVPVEVKQLIPKK